MLRTDDKEFGAPPGLKEIHAKNSPIFEETGTEPTPSYPGPRNPHWKHAVAFRAARGFLPLLLFAMKHQQPDILRQRGVKELNPD